MKSKFLAAAACATWLWPSAAVAASTAAPGMAFIQSDAATGSSRAVVVDDLPLAHTAQVLPLDAAGQLISEGDAARQAEQVLANLDRVLRRAQSGLGNVAKLNVYLAGDEIMPPVQQALAKAFSGPVKPAVAFVTGDLPLRGALVVMDAVAVSALKAGEVKCIHENVSSPSGIAPVAVLPAGPKVYVSGMADTNSLRPATRKTLEKLVAAIGHLGSQRVDIVQLKVFLQPMSEIAAVREVVADFFGGHAPPTVFVEWISANPVVEIELIAAAARDRSPVAAPTNAASNGNSQDAGSVRPAAGGDRLRSDAGSVSYFTPLGTTDSKVYRRVARVNHGKLIYVSGLHGTQATDGAGQVREIFDALGGITSQAGSDFEHLVKATYYVTDDEASGKLNELRPQYYNPLRAPAASKAMVHGTGRLGKTVAMDMIAVTK